MKTPGLNSVVIYHVYAVSPNMSLLFNSTPMQGAILTAAFPVLFTSITQIID